MATTIGMNVPAGAAIVAAMRAETGTCPTYNNAGGAGHYWFTDTAGDVFSAVGCQIGSGSAFVVMMGYVCNSAGNTNNLVTGHLGTSEDYVYTHAVSISNALTSSCLDATAGAITGTATAGTTVTSGSFSTATANEIAVIDASQTNTKEGFGPGSGCKLQNSTSPDQGGIDSGGMGGMEVCPYTSIQSSITVSMSQVNSTAWGLIGAAIEVANGTLTAPASTATATQIGKSLHVTGTSLTISLTANANSGSGIAIWGGGGNLTDSCNSATCVMKCSDTQTNTYTSHNFYDTSFGLGEYLVFAPVSTGLVAGVDTISCNFYKNDGVTPVSSQPLYARVVNIPSMTSVDAVSTPSVSGNVNVGSLTVASGTDFIFGIVDFGGSTAINANPCLGYYTVLNEADGGGGTQFAFTGVSKNTVTPCGNQIGNNGFWGGGASIVP